MSADGITPERRADVEEAALTVAEFVTCPGCIDGVVTGSEGTSYYCPIHGDPPSPEEARAYVEGVRDGAEDNGDEEEAAHLTALLAAYEQAEARADRAEKRARDAEDTWRLTHRLTAARAERDTAQASEARLRESLERIVRLEKKWSAPEKRVTEDDWAAWGAVGSDAVSIARAALGLRCDREPGSAG